MSHSFYHRISSKLLALFFIALIVPAFFIVGKFFIKEYFSFLPEGVSYLGENFSGLNRADSRVRLESIFEKKKNDGIDILVRKDSTEETFRVFFRDLGVFSDVDVAVDRIFDKSFFGVALHGVANVGFEPQKDASIDMVLKRLTSFETSAQDAQIFLDDYSEKWTLRSEHSGFVLNDADRQEFAHLIRNKLVSKDITTEPLEMVLQEVKPVLVAKDLEPLFDRLQRFLDKTVRWNADGYSIVLRLRDYPWLVDVDETQNLIFISEDALDVYVKDWADLFDLTPGEVIVGNPEEMSKGYLKSSFGGVFEEGRQLNRSLFKRRILKALRSDEKNSEIVLPFENLPPVVRYSDGQKLQLLSRGRSSYEEGNEADRVFNVSFGLQKYDGVVIPSGDTFSFNKILGWVTYAAGWKPAPAIFGGGGVKPVPGGGLCQVSTTMYRAAVLEGLPITKRKPHSLDVSYYHKYGYGIDAAVYPPEDIDLRFTNDTPGSIVIHSYVDPVLEEAFVEFYGVDDGRKIVLEQTENQKVLLPRKIVSDSSLSSGRTKVLSVGRVGRYIEWLWTIVRADGTVEKRVIETLYPAAPQVVLRGKG